MSAGLHSQSLAAEQGQPSNASGGDPGSTGTAGAGSITAASASTSNDNLLHSSYAVLDQSPSWKNAVSVFCGSSIGNDPSFKARLATARRCPSQACCLATGANLVVRLPYILFSVSSQEAADQIGRALASQEIPLCVVPRPCRSKVSCR